MADRSVDDVFLNGLNPEMDQEQTLQHGARLMSAVMNAQEHHPGLVGYAASQLTGAKSPQDVQRIARDIEQQMSGLEKPLIDPIDVLSGGAVMKASAMTPGMIARIPGMGSAATAVSELTPNWLKHLATAGADQSLRKWTSEMAGFEVGQGLQKAFTPEAWQKEHPVLNDLAGMGTGMLAAGPAAMHVGWPKTTSELLSPLANEAGSVTIPNVAQGASNLYDQAIGQKISAAGEKLGGLQIPFLGKDSKFGKVMGGNTLSEWFTPAFDRMPEEAGAMFEDTAREAERIRLTLAGSMRDIGDLNFQQMRDLREVLKNNLKITKASPENRAQINQILQPVKDALTTSKSKLLQTPEQEKILNKTMQDGLLKIFAEDKDNPLFQLAKDMHQGDLSTPEGTNKFLDSLIAQPSTPPEARQLALDYRNLRAKSIQAVSNMYKTGFEKVLTARVLENPDWVKPAGEGAQEWINAVKSGEAVNKVAFEGHDFVSLNSAKYPEFDGMLLHRDVAEGFRDMDVVPSSARRFWNTYFFQPWKTFKVVPNVAARLRDPFNQIMFNDVAGAYPLSPFRIDQYIRGARLLTGKIDPQILKAFNYWAGPQDSLMGIDIMPMINALRHDAGPLDMFLKFVYDPSFGKSTAVGKVFDAIPGLNANPVGQMFQDLGKFMRVMDSWTKITKFDWNLKHGMDERAAAVDALKVNGDPLRQSRGTKVIKETMMPFAGWQVHAIKTMGYGIAHHPVRVAKYFAIPAFLGQQAIQELNMTNEDWTYFKHTLPEFAQSSVGGMPAYIPLPMRDEKGRIQMFNLAYWLPGLQDMTENQQKLSSPIGLFQNPAFTLGAALRSNRKFSGAPIYFEWDEPGTKASKIASYIGEQLLPSLTPGVGSAWNKIADSFTDNPEAMTPGQAIGNYLGYKVQPYDQGQQAAKFDSLMKSWQSEAKHQMTKEIEKAGSDEGKIQRIVEKYNQIFQDIAAKRGGVVDSDQE